MSDDNALDFDFFRSLARELVGDIRIAIASGTTPTKEVEAKVARALRDSFESGLSSSLVGVVSAIEAVRVPAAGMVLFRFPEQMPPHGYDALRRDLKAVSEQLSKRLGYQPIILALPDTVEAQAVEFEGPDNPEQDFVTSAPADYPAKMERARQRRIVAFDPLTLRDAVIDVLPDDCGTVTVIPLESSVIEGVAHHTVRIVLPAEGFTRETDVVDAVQGYADLLSARIKLSLMVEGTVPLHRGEYDIVPGEPILE